MYSHKYKKGVFSHSQVQKFKPLSIIDQKNFNSVFL